MPLPRFCCRQPEEYDPCDAGACLPKVRTSRRGREDATQLSALLQPRLGGLRLARGPEVRRDDVRRGYGFRWRPELGEQARGPRCRARAGTGCFGVRAELGLDEDDLEAPTDRGSRRARPAVPVPGSAAVTTQELDGDDIEALIVARKAAPPPTPLPVPPTAPVAIAARAAAERADSTAELARRTAPATRPQRPLPRTSRGTVPPTTEVEPWRGRADNLPHGIHRPDVGACRPRRPSVSSRPCEPSASGAG